MRRRALLCTIGTTVLAGCGGRLGDDDTTDVETATESETTTETTTAPDGESTLELVSHDLVRSNEGAANELATVTGTVRNPTDETVAEATATATFVDDDGGVLDSASASASDLSPGRSWSFELVYPGTGDAASEVADYSLSAETGE